MIHIKKAEILDISIALKAYRKAEAAFLKANPNAEISLAGFERSFQDVLSALERNRQYLENTIFSDDISVLDLEEIASEKFEFEAHMVRVNLNLNRSQYRDIESAFIKVPNLNEAHKSSGGEGDELKFDFDYMVSSFKKMHEDRLSDVKVSRRVDKKSKKQIKKERKFMEFVAAIATLVYNTYFPEYANLSYGIGGGLAVTRYTELIDDEFE